MLARLPGRPPTLPRDRLRGIAADLLFAAQRALHTIAGRPGSLLAVGLVAGATLPALSAWLQPLVPWLLAGTVFCTLMTADQPSGGSVDERRAMAALPFATFGAAALAWLAGRALGAGSEVALWMAMAAAVPGLSGRHAAIPSARHLGHLSVLAMPAVLPLVVLGASLSQADAGTSAISPVEIALIAIPAVLVPAIEACLLGLLRPLSDGRVAKREDWQGLAVACLSALAAARMDGVVPLALERPELALSMLGLAFAVVGSGVVALLLVRWPGGLSGALPAGGSRDATLAWAVALPMLPPEARLLMAMLLLPAWLVPALGELLPAQPDSTGEKRDQPFASVML